MSKRSWTVHNSLFLSFVNKVLLDLHHMHSFTCFLWLTLHHNGRVRELWQRLYGPQGQKTNYLVLQKKKKVESCSTEYGFFLSLLLLVKVKVAQLCQTLCDRMNYTVHGILQARIREWVAVPFSRGSSQPRNPTGVSCIAGRFFYYY